jgi:hypothetical protein
LTHHVLLADEVRRPGGQIPGGDRMFYWLMKYVVPAVQFQAVSACSIG